MDSTGDSTVNLKAQSTRQDSLAPNTRIDILAQMPVLYTTYTEDAPDFSDRSYPTASTDEQVKSTTSDSRTTALDGVNRNESNPPLNENLSVVVEKKELVFVDTGIANFQQLVDDLLAQQAAGRNLEMVVLESTGNGIDQVSGVMAERQDLDAIHFLTHATDRAIKMGNSWLHKGNINDFSDDIAN